MIGIDIVENNRMIGKDIKFINRILSKEEFNIYSSFDSDNRRIEYLASRFAAKEALFKAFKKGNNDLNYNDISILNDENHAPYIKCDKLNDYKFEISISHEKNYSVAIVIII